ncbi:MAG: metal-dependent hydrolase [Candidatus Competibacteraceae bacterium]|nr:metal-dependent hydrolase [Candidatus Competibacteraceae bacterium]
MADFKIHTLGAALVSGIATTSVMMAAIVPNDELLVYFSLGVVGGLLPDIDSDTSIPIRIAFTVLAVVVGFLLVLTFGQRWSLVELTLLWVGCYALIRYGLFELFTKLTTHRGIIHSLPAALASGLVTVLIASHALGVGALEAWLAGSFITLGFVVHLLLDECYSVDLMGRTLKRSFGTAFNLGTRHNLWGTAGYYLAIPLLFYLAPPPDAFLERLLDPNNLQTVLERLLPRHGWFTGVVEAPSTGTVS